MHLEGDDKVLAEMVRRRAGIIAELYREGQQIGFKVEGDAKLNLAARPPAAYDSRLPARPQTHRLARAITSFAEKGVSGARAIIGVLATVPYGRIQEQGGVTGPHDILPVRKLALRFVTPGFIGAIRLTQGGKISRKQGAGITFAKAVHHPGSRIPGNPYLEPAVRGNAGFIEERWRQAVSRGLNGGSSGG